MNFFLRIILPAYLIIPFSVRSQVNLNFSNVPQEASILGEGSISTSMNERDFAISPDGNQLMFTVLIRQSGFHAIAIMVKNKDGRWSNPEVASFSGHYCDLEPAFSPDGNKLFFCSNRPLMGDSSKDYNIWYMEKKNGRWGEPIDMGEQINTQADEFYPSIALNGNLYFTAHYENGMGKEDIYLSRWENGKYSRPIVLDSAVNSAFYEFNAFVSPDEQYILFTSYGRKDDKGGGDLYLSVKDNKGGWQPAKNLVLLNSPQLDYCPVLSFDKKILFFTSERHELPHYFMLRKVDYNALRKFNSSVLNGGGNIYWISFEKVLEYIAH